MVPDEGRGCKSSGRKGREEELIFIRPSRLLPRQ